MQIFVITILFDTSMKFQIEGKTSSKNDESVDAFV